MIKLEVDDICQNCTCFEPVTTVTELYVNDKKHVHSRLNALTKVYAECLKILSVRRRKMTKVKLLYSDELYRLEEAINDFIKDKKIIDIKFNVENGALVINKYALIIYEGG